MHKEKHPIEIIYSATNGTQHARKLKYNRGMMIREAMNLSVKELEKLMKWLLESNN